MLSTLKNLLLGAILLTLQLGAHAQANYQPGSITLNNGQQVAGWIDYREWNRNPRNISFKTDQEKPTTQYSVNDLRYFVIHGKDSFERAIVTKDMRQVKFSEVNAETEDRQETDTAFLRVLVKSPAVDLYALTDSKLHLYVRENGGAYTELQYKVYFDTEKSAISYKRYYQSQLQKYIIGHPKQEKWTRRLEGVMYEAEDVTDFIAGVTETTVKKQKSGSLNFFVGAGALYSSLELRGTNVLNRMSYKGGFGPSAGVGMDIIAARNLQVLTVRVELFYSSMQYKGEGTTFTDAPNLYEISQTNITPALAVLYSFLRQPNYKIYAGAGMGINISSYSKNNYITFTSAGNKDSETGDYLPLQKSWVEFTGRVGGIINSRIEAGLIGKVAGNFNNSASISGKPSTFTLRVGYHFGKR